MNKIVKFIKWFYPGLKIKRWIFLFLIGVALISFASYVTSKAPTNPFMRMGYNLVFSLGFGALIVGVAYLIKSLFEAIYPHKGKQLIDIIYEQRLLAKGPKIVTIGGGTGLSSVLEGFKEYTSNISAIVTVADEGGSSGRLRQEFGILPPGDMRNCLVSLAEAPQLMRDLFQYRFKEGEGIKGHSFGNLFITAMTQVTGSFSDALEESSRVLAIRGKVIPSSLDKIRLRAEYFDGSLTDGESEIPKVEKPIKKITLIPDDPKPNPEAIEVIKEADIIVLGPGSLFTSVVPNLLIKEIQKAVADKKDALKIYICNVMTQNGETNGFTAADHVESLFKCTTKNIIDYCLINEGRLSYDLLLRYSAEKSFPVIPDKHRLEKLGVTPVEDDYVSRKNYLRHDPKSTAKKIFALYNTWKSQWKESKKG